MKKTVVILLCCLTFVIHDANAKSFSQSIGKGKYQISLSAERYEFDTKMLSTSGSYSPSSFNKDFEAPVERDLLMLRGAYGLLEEMDLFLGIGYVDEEWTGDDKSNTLDYVQSGENSIFEVGLKGTAFEFLEDKMYFSYLVRYSYLKSGENFSGPSTPSSSDSIWKEYNINLETGYKIEEISLTPYLGISYFDIKGKQKLNDYVGFQNYDSNFENDKNFGFYLGLDYQLNTNISLNLQGNFGAKKGANLGISYNF